MRWPLLRPAAVLLGHRQTTYRRPVSTNIIDVVYSATVLGFFWSATMNTRIFARVSVLGLRDVE